ncbi:unnamed protein product, partial [Prorocentrum cordatum]
MASTWPTRVLHQGFKHRDVVEGQLDKEAPTLSRLGRHTIMQWATVRKSNLLSADVKSSFLQADYVESRGLKLYATPTKEMREMLSPQIVTKEIGFKNHWLEDCSLLSLRIARASDDPFDICVIDGQHYVVDGLIGKHVDDFLGRGESANTEDDLHTPVDDPEPFKARLAPLNQKFKFGKFEKCLHAVKPITIDKVRRANPTSPLTPKELTSFRTLNGQLQWPAAQGIIIAAVTVSFRAAATGNATVQDMIDANKDLRFLKANADVGLHFSFYEPWSAMRIGTYSDASWASRPDGSSQDGYQIFIGPAEELERGTPTQIVAMEWASKKSQSLCRSSLSAGAQAAALGVDSLMWVKIYVALSLRPDLTGDEAMTHFGQSPLITDAKCLDDASRSVTAGLSIAEKRAAIEVRIVHEQMKEIDAIWRWVNTRQQLRTYYDVEYMRLKYDPNFVAGKKLSKRQAELREQELEQAGDRDYGRDARTLVDLDGGARGLLASLVFVIVLLLGIGLATGYCMGKMVDVTLAQRKMESPTDT